MLLYPYSYYHCPNPHHSPSTFNHSMASKRKKTTPAVDQPEDDIIDRCGLPFIVQQALSTILPTTYVLSCCIFTKSPSLLVILRVIQALKALRVRVTPMRPRRARDSGSLRTTYRYKVPPFLHYLLIMECALSS